jgi:hypothetical protein
MVISFKNIISRKDFCSLNEDIISFHGSSFENKRDALLAFDNLLIKHFIARSLFDKNKLINLSTEQNIVNIKIIIKYQSLNNNIIILPEIFYLNLYNN